MQKSQALLSGVDTSKAGISCEQPHSAAESRDLAEKYDNYWENNIRNRVILVDTKSMAVVYDIFAKIFTMCVKDMLVLDIDTKHDESKEKTLKQLIAYTEFMHEVGIDMLFMIIESDRGMHAVLLNERISPGSFDHLKISLDLCVDIDYTAFSQINGFCQRISPKIVRREKNGPYFYSKEELKDEFIGRLGYKGKEIIGYGTPIPEFINYLQFYLRMTLAMVSLYQHPDFDIEFYFNLERKNIKVNDVILDKAVLPTQNFFDDLTAFLKKEMTRYNINGQEELYQKPRVLKKWIDNYEDILTRQAYYNCGGLTKYDINSRTKSVAIKNWTKECAWQIISVGGKDLNDPKGLYKKSKKYISKPSGKDYPFFFGINSRNRMAFLQFSQLFMGDWDEKEDYPKDLPPIIVDKYFQDEKTMHPEERLFKTYPKFKWYESDNGTHGYIVSGPLNHNENSNNDFPRPLELMRRLCVDGWYIAFVKHRGYSIRVSPKFAPRPEINEIKLDRRNLPILDYYTKEKAMGQFVQKSGLETNKEKEEKVRIFYTGEGEIDPYINSLTDFIMDVKEKILNTEDIYERMTDEEDIFNLSKDLGEIVKESYDRICRPYERSLDPYYLKGLNYYAENAWRCPEKLDLDFFNEEL